MFVYFFSFVEALQRSWQRAEEEGEIEEAYNDVGVGATYKLDGVGQHAI